MGKKSKNIVIRSDPKHVEQMAQSVVDVFEVGKATKMDQATIQMGLRLLGNAHEETWTVPTEPQAPAE